MVGGARFILVRICRVTDSGSTLSLQNTAREWILSAACACVACAARKRKFAVYFVHQFAGRYDQKGNGTTERCRWKEKANIK